ncbi:ROK family transcriptional regulator [Sebaldella sp. S0638]|uniref:ROK family transcriptional regulator n=1 Tax=Sebaldella sp. S0638 TaxID=2957809 RepID=UPI00209EED59|nr:ROK family transcriptional regulator [Sebaldella sp. S0638]MCP1222985.1 ROK family transcriptional regulator [Sebaldella sp. S0638]
MKIGINLQDIKQRNLKAVLRAVNKYGQIPKKEIAEVLGMTPMTISNIANEMIEEGILKTIGKKEEKNIGRKKILIGINYEYKKIIGIYIHQYDEFIKVKTGITYLNSETIDEISLIYKKDEDPMYMFQDISDNIKEKLKKLKINKNEILGIGISIVGIVDQENGISINAQGLWNEKIEVTRVFEENFDIPVHLANNIHTYFLAYKMFGNMKTDSGSYIFLKYGMGIGSALIMNNEIQDGIHFSAGKLSHIRVESPSVVKCSCGDINCLDAVVNFYRIIKEVKEVYSEESTPVLFGKTEGAEDNINIENIFYAYSQGEVMIKEILERKYYAIASVLVDTIKFIDPDKVFITGYGFTDETLNRLFLDYVYELSNRKISREIFVRNDIYKIPQYLGAVALILEKEFYN